MTTQATARPIVSVEQAGKFLGIGRTYAYKLAKSGRLPGCVKLGSRYLVNREALEAFIRGEVGTSEF